MPEVSLVAVLDADKEGFLRSERSLIQTVGRAARNINGAAIFYADKVTGSMTRALAETDRRRQKQAEFNKEHGITPEGVRKQIVDVMEGARSGPRLVGGKLDRVAEGEPAYGAMLPKQLSKEIAKLEKKMQEHARCLEFEEAAMLRDRVAEMREQCFIV